MTTTHKFLSALVLIPFTILCIAIIGRYYGDDNEPHTSPHYHDEKDLAFSAGDLFVQSVMAVGTLGLFWLTRLTLIHANNTANEALKASTKSNELTERSVSALIVSESGRCTLGYAYMATTKEPYSIHFSVKNIGRTIIEIIGQRQIQSDRPMLPLEDTKAIIDESTLIAPGQIIGPDERDNSAWVLDPIELSEESMKCIKTGGTVFFRYEAVYQTCFNTYRHFVFTHRYKAPKKINEQVSPDVMFYDGYTYEREIPEPKRSEAMRRFIELMKSSGKGQDLVS